MKGLGPGGAERLLVAQAAATDRDAVSPAVAYVVPWKRQLVPELEALGVPVQCIGRGKGRGFGWVWRLRRLLRRQPVDVVHVHSPLVAAVTRVLVRTLRHRPALITTEHNVWPRHAWATRFVNRVTVGLDDALVAVSAGVRDSMPARVRERVEVLTHGIDLDAVRAAAPARSRVRAELGLGDDVVLCLTVANFRREKAYPDLLAAASAVVGAGAPAVFVAAGQGLLEGEMRDLHASLGLGDRFRFLGYRTDVPELLAASDLFVLASRHEGLPVALMEALALGVPVVATAVGGVPEAVRDGVEGVLVPPGEPDELAAAIEALVRDPARRAARSDAARARAAMFSVDAPVRRVEALYRTVAGRRR